MSQSTYNMRNIRKLLTTAFSDEELRQLCFDEPKFKPVYEQFSTGMSKSQVIHRLLEYCERKELLGFLLEIVEDEVPDQYNKFADKLGVGKSKTTKTTSSATPDSEQVKKLIASKTRRLYKLQEKQSKYGISAPPEVEIEIEDLEAEIAKLKQQLDA